MFSWNAAEALQYTRVQLDSPSVFVQARGPIIPGDSERLTAFLRSPTTNDRVIGIAVDSPGGNLVEAAQIADFINKAGLSVAVPSDSQCASACFLLFAAAPHRFAGANALIGVHGASDAGKDDLSGMAATTLSGRVLAQYGVPPRGASRLLGRWFRPHPVASNGLHRLILGRWGSSFYPTLNRQPKERLPLR